jgi:hypothetical protein
VPYTPPPYREPSATICTTHRNVVVGVTILAGLALFNVWFWTGIAMINAINPPEPSFVLGSSGDGVLTFADYLSNGRLFIGFVAEAVGTVVSWAIADNVIGD